MFTFSVVDGKLCIQSGTREEYTQLVEADKELHKAGANLAMLTYDGLLTVPVVVAVEGATVP